MTDFIKCKGCNRWIASSQMNSFSEEGKEDELKCDDCSLKKLKLEGYAKEV